MIKQGKLDRDNFGALLSIRITLFAIRSTLIFLVQYFLILSIAYVR